MKNSNKKIRQNLYPDNAQKLVVKVDSEVLFKSGIIRCIPDRTYYLGKFPHAPESRQVCICRTHPGGSTSFLLTGINGQRGIFEAAMTEIALDEENFELTKSIFNLKITEDEKSVERLIYDALEIHSKLNRPLPAELETGLHILQYNEQEVNGAASLSPFQKKTEQIEKYVSDKKHELKESQFKKKYRRGSKHFKKGNTPQNSSQKNNIKKENNQGKANGPIIGKIFDKQSEELTRVIMGNALFTSNVPLPKELIQALLDEVRAGGLTSEKIKKILQEQITRKEHKLTTKKNHLKGSYDDQVGEPFTQYLALNPTNSEASPVKINNTEQTGNDEQFNSIPSSNQHKEDKTTFDSNNSNKDKMDNAKADVFSEATNVVDSNTTDAINERQDATINVESNSYKERKLDDVLNKEKQSNPDNLSVDSGEKLARTFGAYLNLGLNQGSEFPLEDYTLLAQRLIKKFPDVFDFQTTLSHPNKNQLDLSANSKNNITNLTNKQENSTGNKKRNLKINTPESNGREEFEKAIRKLSEEKNREALEELGPDVPNYDPNYCKHWSIYDWRNFLDEDRHVENDNSLLLPGQFQPLMYLFRAWVRDVDAHEATLKELQYLKTHPAVLSDRQILTQDYKPTFEEIEFQFDICNQFATAFNTSDKLMAIAHMEEMLEKFPENPFFWHRLHRFHIEMGNKEQAFRTVCRRFNTSKDRQAAVVGYFIELFKENKASLLTDFLKETILFEKHLSDPAPTFNEQYYHHYYQTLALHFTTTNQWMEFITLVDLFYEMATSRNDLFRKKFWNILYSEAVFFMNEVLITLNDKREFKDTFLECLHHDESLGDGAESKEDL
ncbi:hypothetical protein SAMN05192529_11536 [Arachidicoccus rhizosphaerae]|uniref:Uncharacterized protein n=1 Tax=Arachidicoccus rhizosphaerae TaxID=551991 RepID=A0A1H4AKX3_9BACT|nr:hypothetical protein [Arachidicoccus rhizosphaerae]SEA36302.1 hypothetical protein SAMN05192529_11536 [Arachidicoccus rhizosphaerae]